MKNNYAMIAQLILHSSFFIFSLLSPYSFTFLLTDFDSLCKRSKAVTT